MRSLFRTNRSIGSATIRPVAAEIGRAGFIASSAFALIGTVIEHRLPGTFFSYIAPQHLAAVLIACGALALLNDHPRHRGLLSIATLALVGTVIAAAAIAIAASRFAPLGPEGRRLAIACGVAAFLPFFLFRRFGANEH
jgi:hypothetical protein